MFKQMQKPAKQRFVEMQELALGYYEELETYAMSLESALIVLGERNRELEEELAEKQKELR